MYNAEMIHLLVGNTVFHVISLKLQKHQVQLSPLAIVEIRYRLNEHGSELET